VRALLHPQEGSGGRAPRRTTKTTQRTPSEPQQEGPHARERATPTSSQHIRQGRSENRGSPGPYGSGLRCVLTRSPAAGTPTTGAPGLGRLRMPMPARHATRALLRAHLSAASGYRHRTRHCPICHQLLRLAMEAPPSAPQGDESGQDAQPPAA
jgi:hypothetical protein